MDATTLLIILLASPFWLPALAVLLLLVGVVCVLLAVAMWQAASWMWAAMFGVRR